MMNKALTLTIIFKAGSLNYGEGIGNISELKKVHRSNGDVFSFASRQSIRYDIVRLGNELFDWNLDTVSKAKGTVQFKDDINIKDSVEMDLFGYLKTAKKSQKRAAVVRLSHAFSMEPYNSDIEFLNNMGLAERIGETPNLANIEQHESLYTYTVTIDLSQIGEDGKVKINPEEKAKRVNQLLDILKILNRNIRGRQESLNPLFVIGGLYPISNPFFLGNVEINKDKEWNLKTGLLEDALNVSFGGASVKSNTAIGLQKEIFKNELDIRNLVENSSNVEDFFNNLKENVSKYYKGTE